MLLKSSVIRKRLVLIVLLDLVLGFALPGVVFLQSYHVPGSTSIDILPVGQTVFGEFVDTSSDSSQLQSIWKVNSTRPFILLHNYSQVDHSDVIDSSSALSIALNRLNTLNYGGWQLIESEELLTPPTWYLTLETLDGNYTSRIRIDAVSSVIYDYHVQYEHELEGGVLPESMSEQQAEEIATNFLRSFNYSLPQNSRYEDIRLVRYSSYQDQIVNLTYRMTFQEYISDIKIATSEIRIDVSTYQKAVCCFNYDWLGVPYIPQTGILSKDNAFLQVVSEISNSTDPRFMDFNPSQFSIEDIYLILTLLPDGNNFSSSESNAYQLCWRGVLKSPTPTPQYLGEVYCDAFSGDVVFVDDSLGSLLFLPNIQSITVLDFIMADITLGIATLSGILTYIIARWRIRRR